MVLPSSCLGLGTGTSSSPSSSDSRTCCILEPLHDPTQESAPEGERGPLFQKLPWPPCAAPTQLLVAPSLQVKLKEQEQPDSTTVGTSPRRPSPPAWQRHLCGHPAVAGPPPAATPQRPSPSFSSSFPLFSHFFSLLSFVPGTRKAAMTLFPRPFRTQFALSRLHWFGVMEPASSPRASVPTAECAGLCGPPRARHPPAVHLGGLPGCGRVWEAPTPPRLVCKPLARSDLMQLRGRAPRLCPSPPGLHQKPWPHQ